MALNKRLAGRELTVMQLQIFKQYKRGFSNRNLLCPLCGLDLRTNNLVNRRSWKVPNDENTSEVKQVVAFHCHHAFHERCLKNRLHSGKTHVTSAQSSSCSICRPANANESKQPTILDPNYSTHNSRKAT
ncbi:unnamed protein product [Heterobilharzia americana]|nr:unnamed protein product [Heterobilharzia americana]